MHFFALYSAIIIFASFFFCSKELTIDRVYRMTAMNGNGGLVPAKTGPLSRGLNEIR